MAAGDAALAVGASGGAVGVRGALHTTVAAVLHIALDACLTSILVVVVAVLESGFAPRIRGTWCCKQEVDQRSE